MIRLVIFDLDGVLYESKEFHFDALNEALGEVSNEYKISKEEHLKTYDGLSTYKKLEILTEDVLKLTSNLSVFSLASDAIVPVYWRGPTPSATNP